MAKWWKSYRFADNPSERLFYEAWLKENEHSSVLEYLMSTDEYGRRQPVSERDEQVSATVIQWLGSPVGRAFLRSVRTAPKCKAAQDPRQFKGVFLCP